MLYAFYFLIHSLLWVYLKISFTTYASSDTGVCVYVCVFMHVYGKTCTCSLQIVASFQP